MNLELEQRLYKCVKCLKKGSKVKKSLKRMLDIDLQVTFHEYNIEEAVSPYLNDEEYGPLARRVLEKMTEYKPQPITKEEVRYDRDMSPDTYEPMPKFDDSDYPWEPTFEEKPKIKEEMEEVKPLAKKHKKRSSSPAPAAKKTISSGIRPLTEEEFAKAFGVDSKDCQRKRPPPKKKSTFEAETLASLRSDSEKLAMKVKVVPPREPEEPKRPRLQMADEDMFKPRKERQKVFAGRRKVQNTMHSLIELSQNALSTKLNAIGHVGLCPYFLIKPVLEKMTAEQLENFLECNPGLEEESDELFKTFVERHPLGNTVLEDGKPVRSWKRKYTKLCKLAAMQKNKEGAKLQFLTDKFLEKKAKNSDVGRKTMILEAALTPRDVRRRQMKHGTVTTGVSTPSAKDLSFARKAVANGDKSKLSALPSTVVNRNSTLGGRTGDNKPKKPTTGPLMKKTMKMLNMKRR
ncbi:unnamed protein product [Caenorhabditis auriculariae]|uniref:Uncharacterized protein n=1 Tax=Caenorhabditis auriculariae TaxID=2777116 RepID=A0A8S1H2C1_9PELO|nr:unnamed protein product [Caenorhabditis auriculariae]